MKRLLFSFVLSVVSVLAVMAVPANPTAERMLQPDGTYVTLRLHGDEFLNFFATSDGYTVVKGDDGYWRYAVKSDGVLTASDIIARDADARTQADKAFLASTNKYLLPEASASAKAMRSASKAMSSMKLKASGYDYDKFRGLVILVEFSDRSFIRDDANEIFTNMMNEENYTGFMSDSDTPELVPYTGSVRDYFRDNSTGLFNPQFDVVGPVKIDVAQTYPNQTAKSSIVMKKALAAADDLIDYSQYDTDGDNVVDMVYFIFAGGGSNYTVNNQSYIWPHSSTLSYKLDGVSFGRYSCSTELYGRESRGIIDGIGVIVHEFSHVLGLPDLYDTDYETNGQSIHPNTWSVMAAGNYFNKSRTPCGYSLYERYALGFATPTLIEGEGSFTLNPLNTSNEGYRINSATDNEYFLIENRQQTAWDAYLEGHGMLVFRVDSTNTSVWLNNKVNTNPTHNYYELLRATATADTTDWAGDPFPGTGGVTRISSTTTPSLNSWTGAATALAICDISESDDGIITFSTAEDNGEDDSAVRQLAATAFSVSREGNVLSVTAAGDGGAVSVYSSSGTLIKGKRTGGGGLRVVLPAHGVYIIKQGGVAKKVAY